MNTTSANKLKKKIIAQDKGTGGDQNWKPDMVVYVYKNDNYVWVIQNNIKHKFLCLFLSPVLHKQCETLTLELCDIMSLQHQ